MELAAEADMGDARGRMWGWPLEVHLGPELGVPGTPPSLTASPWDPEARLWVSGAACSWEPRLEAWGGGCPKGVNLGAGDIPLTKQK